MGTVWSSLAIISSSSHPHHAAEWEKWHSWCRASAGSLPSRGRSPSSGRWSAAAAPGNVLLLLFLLPLRWRRHHWHRRRTDSWCWPAAAGGRSPILTHHTAGHWCKDESTQGENQSKEHVFFIYIFLQWFQSTCSSCRRYYCYWCWS